MQMSFGTLELTERLKRDNVLMKIDALIESAACPRKTYHTRG